MKIKLGDVLEIKRGQSLPGIFYSDEGRYLRLTLANFYESGGFKEFKSTDDKFYIGQIKKESILRKGDLITPLTEQTHGLLGSVAFIPQDDLYIHSQDIGLIECNESKLDKIFVYYLFLSPIVRKQISAAAQQTKIRHTSPSKIYDVKVDIPSIDIQRKISRLLFSIDSKISMNKKINIELESIAKTIYDYWFLQFEFPNKDGEPYKSSGGKMVWNEELRREVPEGWQVVSIESIIDVRDGTHDSPKYTNEGKYLITSKHLNKDGIDFSSANHISDIDFDNINKRSKVDKNDILFSMIGSMGVVYRIDENDINFAIKNVALYKTSQNVYIAPYIYSMLISSQMYNYIKTTMSGSIQKFISLGDLRKMTIIYNKSIIENFSKRVEEIFELLSIIKKESQELRALRDFLLPVLINGQASYNTLLENSENSISNKDVELPVNA